MSTLNKGDLKMSYIDGRPRKGKQSANKAHFSKIRGFFPHVTKSTLVHNKKSHIHKLDMLLNEYNKENRS